ncbi:MAG TPA: hypothetical protein VFT50_05820 [Baekduia sp.]|nr:hypothetical protein [Baekduia sp.]
MQACSDGDTFGIPVSDPFGGWAGEVSQVDASHVVDNDCAGALGLFMQLKGTDRKAAGDSAGWKFTAPSNTKVTGATLSYDVYTRPSNGTTNGSFLVTVNGSATPLASEHGGGLLPDGQLDLHDLSARSLRVAVYCESPTDVDCPDGEDGRAILTDIRMTLADDLAPAVPSATGDAIADSSWAGTQQVALSASDFGSGVAEFRVYVDDVLLQASTPDDNDGTCIPDSVDGGVPLYHAPKPCPGSVTATETIDSTTIPDGPHDVELVVADASGRETVIASGTKVVANNPPVAGDAPAFVDAAAAAAPHIGDVLEATRGTWGGPDLTYALAWERCEGDGSACGQIPGATIASYIPTSADLGKRLRLAVTATNPAGSVTNRTPLTGAVGLPAAQAGGGADGGSAVGDPSAPTLSAGASPGAPEPQHVLVGHVAGEPPAATCPQDRASLVLQGVSGHTVRVRHGRQGRVRVALTCAATGKAIAGARLDVATRTGSAAAVASQARTDGAGHATLTFAPGPSRNVTVGYRMYADDPLARATVTLRVRVKGRVSLRASRRTLHNGQAVRLSGALAGGHVPRRGVDLAVQWRDGRRWRPFAQVRTNRHGRFRYAYRFTRSFGRVRYALRVQVLKGQVDYPFAPAASKAVRVTVGP